MKYFRKDIIKVQVVGFLYIHRLLHGKMKIKIYHTGFLGDVKFTKSLRMSEIHYLLYCCGFICVYENSVLYSFHFVSCPVIIFTLLVKSFNFYSFFSKIYKEIKNIMIEFNTNVYIHRSNDIINREFLPPPKILHILH